MGATPEQPEELVRGKIAFKQSKKQGRQNLHRLRNWEPGDTVWGYEVRSDGSYTGKTFRREGPISEGLAAAESAYEQAVERASPGTMVFLYVATVQSVGQEPPGPDPGEPPMKFGHLEDVCLLDSHYKQDDAEEQP